VNAQDKQRIGAMLLKLSHTSIAYELEMAEAARLRDDNKERARHLQNYHHLRNADLQLKQRYSH
jgi:hypothetical protein